jgi:isopenicillin-N epimerase
LSVPAAIQFQEEHDWDKVRIVCHEFAIDTEKRIRKLTGLPSQYADDSWFEQMFVAALPASNEFVTLKSLLYDEFKIEVPLINWNSYKMIRVSVQGYNTEEDTDKLINALEETLNTNP